jgi:8-oxo-dGTP pyrophosphatase MutT (NUDIX family)
MAALFEQLRAALQARPPRQLNLPGVELREAAVLAPMFERSGEVWMLFTRRPMTLKTHAGQISFPGGGRDDTDPTPLHTALRETHEELGIPPSAVDVLGMLDELPTITRYRVAPFVGVIPGEFVYVPSAEEIEEIIEVPLRKLMDPASVRTETWRVDEQDRDVYFYDYGPHTIWGATARMLKGLLEIVAGLPAWEKA